MQARSDEEWVWDLVVERARATPEGRCALDESGRELTFGDLAARAERVAAALHADGVGPGTPVCWQLPTWIESLVLTTALCRVGAVQVPLLPIYRERELSVVVEQVRPTVAVVPSTWRGFDYDACWRGLGVRTIVCDRSLPEADAGALDDAHPSADEHRWIFFSSGTTGTPKGALHTDASVLAGPMAFCERIALGAGDLYPIIFPFTHVGGIGTLLAELRTGAAALLDEQFDPSTTIPFMAANDITIGAGGTPLVQLYLEHQRRQPEVPLFPGLRLCLAGAAPKPPTLHAAVQSELGGRGCMSVYGLTEAPFLTATSIDDTDAVLATTEGSAIAGGELRVVGLDGRECGPGEEGELRARGPQVMLGYLDRSLDTDAFDEEGFFRTGDLARLDGHGNVSITGRIKEIIIRKGENISALEVEQVLVAHPAVSEVAVVGLPDPSTGERCCAIVVVAAGASITLDDVRTFARVPAGLATQKTPEQLEVVDVLPRNAAGKVLKHELRAASLARLVIVEFRDEVRTWLHEHLVGEFARHRGRGGIGRDDVPLEVQLAWERELATGGWVGLGYPEHLGGRPATLDEQVAFHEELAASEAPGRLGNVGATLLGPTLLAFGTPEQQERFVPGIVQATQHWCQGYSEPDAGSDLAGIRTRAARDGDEWVLDGQKVWCTLAHVAEWCFVLARTDPASERHGLSYLLVPMGQDGFRVRPIRQPTGSEEFSELFFDGARTDADLVVGDVGDGWRVAMGTLGFERGVGSLGMQLSFAREVDDLIDLARRTDRLGDRLLRDELVQAWIEVRIMGHNAERSLAALGDSAPGAASSISKLYWSQWFQRFGELAMKIRGASAMVADDGAFDTLQQRFLFGRAVTIFAGSSEIQRNILGESVLGLPREPR